MIEIKNLVKKFKRNKSFITAVDDMTFSISDNEIFGILGKNGAGKTTLIRMLTMQLAPTSGEIFYNGKILSNNPTEIKKLIGVVPQHINFDQDLNVGENLELHARLFGIEKIERQRRINELLNYMELSDCVNENIRKLSGGMKRRLLIARALIHRPQFLFLDEPTVALDPQVRRKIWSLIEDLQKGGATIILTTHYIEEAEKLCKRVAILNRGKLIAVDTPQNLCNSLESQNTALKKFDEGFHLKDNLSASEAFSAANKSTLEEVFIRLTEQKEKF